MTTYRLTDPLGFNEEFEADSDPDVAFGIAQGMLTDWYDDVTDYPGGTLYVVGDGALSLLFGHIEVAEEAQA